MSRSGSLLMEMLGNGVILYKKTHQRITQLTSWPHVASPIWSSTEQVARPATKRFPDLWRGAVDRGHGGATTRRPSLATRTWWWWWWWWYIYSAAGLAKLLNICLQRRNCLWKIDIMAAPMYLFHNSVYSRLRAFSSDFFSRRRSLNPRRRSIN